MSLTAKKTELKKEIAELEEQYTAADTPQNIKDMLKGPLDNARKQLKDVEELIEKETPATQPVVKKEEKQTEQIIKAAKKVVTKIKQAKQEKKGSKKQKKTLQQIISSNKELKKLYAGKSAKALKSDASRTSASGKVYREYRADRSDLSGRAPYLAKGASLANKDLAEIKKFTDAFLEKSRFAKQFGAQNIKAPAEYKNEVVDHGEHTYGQTYFPIYLTTKPEPESYSSLDGKPEGINIFLQTDVNKNGVGDGKKPDVARTYSISFEITGRRKRARSGSVLKKFYDYARSIDEVIEKFNDWYFQGIRNGFDAFGTEIKETKFASGGRINKDIYLKDEGDFVTAVFMSDAAKQCAREYFPDMTDESPKADIGFDKVQWLKDCAADHNLTVDDTEIDTGFAKGGHITDEQFELGTPVLYHSIAFNGKEREESGEVVVENGKKGISLYSDSNYAGASERFIEPDWNNVETFAQADQRQQKREKFKISGTGFAKGGHLQIDEHHEALPNFKLLVTNGPAEGTIETTLDDFMDANEETMDSNELDKVKSLQPGEEVHIGVHAGWCKIERPKEFAEGGHLGDDPIWHNVGLNRPPANFTPAAAEAFKEAITELQKEKPGTAQGGTFNNYYETASSAMTSLVTIIAELLSFKDNKQVKNKMLPAEEVHYLLQKVGIYNYKTGLLLNTDFLNKELATRKLEKGGDVDEEEEVDFEEQQDEPDYENDSFIDAGGRGGKYNVSFAGKFIGEADEMDEALEMIAEAQEKSPNYFPTTWFVSDHGNAWPIDKDGNEIKYASGGEIAKGKNIAFKDNGIVVRMLDNGDLLVRDASGNTQTIPASRVLQVYKKGGRPKSALMRDRAYQSQEPWEQAYSRAGNPKHPHYAYAKGGQATDVKDQIDYATSNKQIKKIILDAYAAGNIVEVIGYNSGGNNMHLFLRLKNNIIVAIHFNVDGIEFSKKAWDSIDKWIDAGYEADTQGGFGEEPNTSDYGSRSWNTVRANFVAKAIDKALKYQPASFSKGGAIPNNYAGKTSEQVWNGWTVEQRTHFLNDHGTAKFKGKAITAWANKKYADFGNDKFDILGRQIKQSLEDHIAEGQYAKGGQIENQYAGKTSDQIWDEWTLEQREHFLEDHGGEFIPELKSRDQYSDDYVDKYQKYSWDGLPKAIKHSVQDHRQKGQYAKGGNLSTLAKDFAAHSSKALVVVCKSVGNPDYRQDPDKPISPQEFYAVNTLKEASDKCRQYIEEWDLGGGNWAGGQVYDIDGKIIAHISYNGRVWAKDPADFTSANGNTEFTEKKLTEKWYAKGGRTSRGISRDRKFKSQEPHEQAYKRKTSPKNPRYKKENHSAAKKALKKFANSKK